MRFLRLDPPRTDLRPVADHLDRLEALSVHVLREAYASFPRLCMLWSIGKDSTVLLWLARKAFFGHVPFPLVHIDTSYKLPEMIAYRDRLALAEVTDGGEPVARRDPREHPGGGRYLGTFQHRCAAADPGAGRGGA